MNPPLRRLVLPAALLVAGLALGWGLAQWRLAASSASAPSAAASAERKVLYWYDPMVPSQRFDKPGKSPFMDMQLVPRYADEGEPGAAAGSLAVSTQAQQALGLRLAAVQRRALGAGAEVAGTVQLSERDISIVQARTAGFVERVHARAPGDVVAAGAPLAEVMNPEWLAAQQEYLAVRATGDAALTQAARQRLLWLGMPATGVEQVEKTGRAQALQTITAPSGGVLTELAVRPGMTLSPGMTLARINGLGTVWLEAALPEAQAALARPGQPVQARFAALPGEVVTGRITAVLPEADRDTRTLRLRIELPNPGRRLTAGLYAQVTLQGASHEALVVPAEALIRTGRRTLVYLAEPGGRYRPVEVEAGEQAGDQVEVKRGLAEGQQVVVSGQFLLDSEASLQGLLARGAAAPAAVSSASATAAPGYRTRGVVVSVETDGITLKHEAIPALKWPPMTMPFQLAEPQLARGLAPGQAVDFTFVQRGDEHVVTAITPATAGGAR